jgi:pterin-4a-carbinolamine dehydratase
MAKKLGTDERAQALARVPAWTLVNGRDAIFRSFKLKDINEAF